MNIPDGVILSISSYDIKNDEVEFLGQTNPLGFVLFKRNFSTKKQLLNLIKKLKTLTMNKSALIFIDQEGGRVQRLNNHEFIKFPPQKIFGELFLKDKILSLDLAYKTSFLLGYELKQVGIDVNFSPVCDIYYDYGHSVIGDRSFGNNPNAVKILSKQYCKGLRESGIIPVIKHFPGHGRSYTDTHNDKSIVSTDYSELKKTDLVPFSFLKEESLVMLSHIIYSDIDNEVSTYSKKINKILRLKNKFNGLILTDDISMKALKDKLENIVEKSYDAGCDVVLYCKGNLREMKAFYPFTKKLKKEYYTFFLNDMLKMKTVKHKIDDLKEELMRKELIKI